jgi:hypothetical protein
MYPTLAQNIKAIKSLVAKLDLSISAGVLSPVSAGKRLVFW